MTEPLVLIPGHMCDARIFLPQIAALSGRASVVAASISSGETIQEIARRVVRDAPREFSLAGLSMGGIVAMEILRTSPERVVRVALLDTNCRSETALSAEIREQRIRRVESGRLAEVVRDEMKPAYLAAGPARDRVLDTVMDMAISLGPDVFARQSRALLSRMDYSESLALTRVPSIVICGAEDRLCPVARHREIAEIIPGAKLEVVDGAGHLPTLEKPEQVCKLLAEWMGM
ncbi:MAG: alpha/beta fold hydrolase [Albidovulum sp.]|nr:alpha/beta fold hydrolase [Albidovulum sp.]